MSGYISEFCPNCGAEVAWRAGLFTRDTVGPETETCTRCGESYATGCKEWMRMSPAERGHYYRRVAGRCAASFLFCVMALMLAAFMGTGAVFNVADPTLLRACLIISLTGGLLLAGRVLQLGLRRIKQSVEREP
jgi:ribosomal protein S27AE